MRSYLLHHTLPVLSAWLIATAALGCGDGDESSPSGGGSGGTAATSSGGGGASSSGSGGTSSSGGGSASSTGSGGGETGALIYQSGFDGDAPSWPAPWQTSGNEVLVADVVGGQARLIPVLSGYSLARMVLPGNELDAEASYAFTFSEVSRQGIGFYMRQNGGYLTQTQPPGEGYALFVEGFSAQPGLGVWHEENGEEIPITSVPFPLQNNVPYRVRLRVTQLDPAQTLLQARIWQDGQPEPDSWQLEHTDSLPHLQGITGGFAFDAWSTNNGQPAPPLLIDDIEIRQPQ